MKRHFIQFINLIFMLTVVPVSYAQGGNIKFKNEAFKEEVVINKSGKKEYKLIQPGQAVPGDEIVYITTFTNIGNENVTDIEITNPLPNNSIYKADSAFGSGTEITFSIDGGKTYNSPEKLTIKQKDGRLRAANADEYNSIKWVFKNNLPPGAESTVMFRTFIK